MKKMKGFTKWIWAINCFLWSYGFYVYNNYWIMGFPTILGIIIIFDERINGKHQIGN